LFHVPGGHERLLDAPDARVEAGVPGPAEVLIHERDLVIRLLSVERRADEREVPLHRRRRIRALRAGGGSHQHRKRRHADRMNLHHFVPTVGMCFSSSATAASSCESRPVYHSPIGRSIFTSTWRGCISMSFPFMSVMRWNGTRTTDEPSSSPTSDVKMIQPAV